MVAVLLVGLYLQHSALTTHLIKLQHRRFTNTGVQVGRASPCVLMWRLIFWGPLYATSSVDPPGAWKFAAFPTVLENLLSLLVTVNVLYNNLNL